MSLRATLLLTLLLPLAACNKDAPAPTAETAPATTEAATPAAPATDAPATAATPAAPVAESADIPPAASPDVPVGPAPVAGIDYEEIAGGQPFEPGSGKIEVVEVFSYTCPHCAAFEPLVRAWRARQPADVKFTPVAGPFGGNPEPFARAYYAAESLGLLGKTHEAMFRAVHLDHKIDMHDANAETISAWYAGYGADAAQFASTMGSFAVDAKFKRALQFMQRSAVDSSPSVVVDGKYKIKGKTLEDTLRIATHLVAQERAARSGG
ncbi:thiol:disulfide interchange protein DsbA/DsbL [Agrilutibacter solisilvae]|uniref:Thiol:disulfide interchange protein DsbA/DsbL n=1 Tax=Agrilutibacter solisilvae TaxID=2763317 RepID=A0A975ASP6_9GAMM|nr:thiol:disulfide interchange protein DsbA/DsbL [Lysobacter solisilvae]QSX78982.1 thiol:disulfide interchange protein DsbA/DsbL [Lysobacter solisilvae]